MTTTTKSDPPPPFTDDDDDLEPPPEFAPYDAEYFTTSNGDVVSHDDHLNTDGEALYRFLLAQSLQAPYYQLHCRGTHSETRFREVVWQNSNHFDHSHHSHHSHSNHHRSGTDREQYNELITDFDFLIDIRPSLRTSVNPQSDACGPIHWSVADSEPAYRGKMVREYDESLIGGKRVANRKETKEYDVWRSECTTRGLPPWAHWQNSVDETTALKSSKSLRQWADEYCASQKYLKEFVYKKALYGWDVGRLEEAVRVRISSAPYNGSIEVSFGIKDSKVYVRPDNRLSRMLSNKWLKFLSIILLIFPFIWLFKRFHSRGGGRWEVCGGAYALKRTIDSPYSSHTRPNNVIGVREGEWFRKWEGVIRQAVVGRYQSSTPIPFSDEEDLMSLVGYLDGL